MPQAKTSKIDDRELKQAFRQLRKAGANMSLVFADFGEYMMQETEKRFSTQRDPDGKPWTPLSPKTLKNKRHRKIMTESTELRGSIRYAARPKFLAVGTDKVYGAIHQLGSTTGQPVKIPARPYLGFARADIKEFLQVAGEHLARAGQI